MNYDNKENFYLNICYKKMYSTNNKHTIKVFFNNILTLSNIKYYIIFFFFFEIRVKTKNYLYTCDKKKLKLKNLSIR